MSGPEGGKITSLRDLPRDVTPPRDLWKAIEAQLVAEPHVSADKLLSKDGQAAGGDTLQSADRRISGDPLLSKDGIVGDLAGARANRADAGLGTAGRRRLARLARPEWMRGIAAAAVVASLAVGIWIGRAGAPNIGQRTTAPMTASTNSGRQPEALHAAFMMDARYTQQREELAKNLSGRIAALPPESREKVIASLATIHKSIQDLQAALGRDPTNALLQELLVNTYQDEMRVLTAVHDAGNAGQGI